jgi:uncharacterized coiled-coil protein SlyX
MESFLSLHNYLHIDQEMKKLEYECSQKDEEIEKNQVQIKNLWEKLEASEKAFKDHLDEDQEEVLDTIKDQRMLDLIKNNNLVDINEIYISSPNFLEIMGVWMQDKDANSVYYHLFAKIMKFDFLEENIGMNR